MLLLLSPAKTQDFRPHPLAAHTLPTLLDQTCQLIESLRQLNVEQIGKLLKTSQKISLSSWTNLQNFHTPFTPSNAKQALLAFKGAVYREIQTEQYSENDFQFAQKHLCILSGLYGILRPLDLIQPYRLEMATALATTAGKNLYSFWRDVLTKEVNQALTAFPDPVLINLTSQEYFKAILPEKITGKIITISFKENKNGAYKTIAIHAKKARGKMVDFVITNRLSKARDLFSFAENGYQFNKGLSSSSEIVFCRG